MISTAARGAWWELTEKLRPYIARRVPVGIDPNDILQDVFVRLHRGQESLRDDDSFGGWVYRVTRTAIVDHVRTHLKKATIHAPLSAGDEEYLAAPVLEEDLTPELGPCVTIFVARLPSPFREAVTLTELQGVTHKSAAEMLNVPLSTLKSRVARGRDKIRQMFEECCVMQVDSRGRVTQCDARNLSEMPVDCHSTALEWSAKHKGAARK